MNVTKDGEQQWPIKAEEKENKRGNCLVNLGSCNVYDVVWIWGSWIPCWQWDVLNAIVLLLDLEVKLFYLQRPCLDHQPTYLSCQSTKVSWFFWWTCVHAFVKECSWVISPLVSWDQHVRLSHTRSWHQDTRRWGNGNYLVFELTQLTKCCCSLIEFGKRTRYHSCSFHGVR